MASLVLQELVEAVGLGPALTITRVYGGRTLRVPMRAGSVHPLTLSVGIVAAQALCREFGGCELNIPTERTALLEQRNELICAAYRSGISVKTLAARYTISRKMVRNILKALGAYGNGPTPSK